ncbi:phosphoglycerate dehydrogenase-like enzyme [Amorphus sp. MBR-141]
MTSMSIIFASAGFEAARSHLGDAVPDAQIAAIDGGVLRQDGAEAEILIPAMTRVDGPLMDRIAGLRLIHQFGSGLEGVDVAAATERGIAVANVPTAGTGNAESVAEWCVMAAIAVMRLLPVSVHDIRAGGSWGKPAGRALLGKTAGIVGLGGIGEAVAARLGPFGMRRIAVKRTEDPAQAARLGMAWVGTMEALPKLLEEADIVFLCLPVTAETRAMIDRAALDRLGPEGVLINASRGGLVDEDALTAALAEGRIAGAGLDVFATEPLDPASPLLRLPNVVATPHIAGVTDVSYAGISAAFAENVRRLRAGEALANCVNAEAVRS